MFLPTCWMLNLRAVLLLLVLLISNPLFSQKPSQVPPLPNPVSPKSFEFLKYTEVPVSTYTGVPNISVPIYTIQAAGLEIPIALSYHSNGVRVNEEAGSVGLGWTLTGSGNVIQIINGYEDSYAANIYPNPADFNIPGGIGDNDSKGIWYVKEKDEGINDLQLSGFMDTQPDIFKFSFGEYSGEFAFDYNTKSFVCLNNSRIRIKSDLNASGSNLPQYFYITVPEGHTFHFQLLERTVIDQKYSIVTPFDQAPIAVDDVRGHATSKVFQLVLVYTNKGEEIYFKHQPTATIKNYPSITQSETRNTIPDTPEAREAAGPLFGTVYYPPYVKSVDFLATSQSYSYLQYIETDKVYIEFLYSSNRTDLAGAKRLDQIIIRNNAQDRAVIKTFYLSYDYFIGHMQGNTVDAYLSTLGVQKTEDERLKRLKLISVRENNDQPYLFYYNSTQLPSKTSLAYDHLGFYNMNHSAELGSFQTAPISEVGTKAAVLNSITYPTGGKVTFDYELNGLDDPRLEQVPILEDVSGHIILADKNFNPNNPDPYIGEIGPAAYHPSGYAVWLDVPFASEITIRRYLSVAGPCSSINPSNEEYYPNTYWRMMQFNETAEDLVASQGWSAIPSIVGNSSYLVSDDKGQLRVLDGESKNWEVPPGTTLQVPKGLYWFNVNLNDACGAQTQTGASGEAFMQIDYNVKRIVGTRSEIVYTLASGLRVTNITSYDEEGNRVLLKSFKYKGPKQMSPSVYKYTEKIDFDYDHQDPGGLPIAYGIRGTAVTTTSHSIYNPSSSASGKYIGYDEVEVRTIDATNAESSNGYIKYSYQNIPDKKETNLDKMPLIVSDLENGLVLQEAHYKENMEEPVEKVINHYSYEQLPCYYGMLPFFKRRSLVGRVGLTFIYNTTFDIGFYPIKRQETLLHATERVKHTEIGDIKHLQLYEYDDKNQLRKSIAKNHLGHTVQTEYQYPYDLSNDAVATAMVAENLIAPYVLKNVTDNGDVVHEEKIDYKWIDQLSLFNTHNFFDVARIQNRRSLADAYTVEGECQLYDEDKILQYIGKDGTVTSFIWGYDKEYLVAKVVGASHQQVMNLVNSSVLNNPIDEATLRNELNKIRTGLPHAIVTSYTYRPLIGLSTETDPNGRTTYFKYEPTTNRLESIRDHDGNLISHYKYHFYKN